MYPEILIEITEIISLQIYYWRHLRRFFLKSNSFFGGQNGVFAVEQD
jgi:hypothetical protein